MKKHTTRTISTLMLSLVMALAVLITPHANAAMELYFIHNDHLGTPQIITDKNQTVVWEGRQKPFGETEVTTNTIDNDARFPGQYLDEETGLHYNYFRDYDPTIGRYIQSDPIGLGGGINTYGYVGGNPLTRVDYLGLETCLLITRNSFGFGNHAALYGSKGSGEPFLYDPSGSYGQDNGSGSGDLLSGDKANIRDFTKHHKEEGDSTESICKETTEAEEREFERLAEELGGGPTGGFCAKLISEVIGESSAFPKAQKGTWLPGNLANDAK